MYYFILVRPASSAAANPSKPTGVAQPAPGGGFLSNIASTAAGVAIGHTVGHAITGKKPKIDLLLESSL